MVYTIIQSSQHKRRLKMFEAMQNAGAYTAIKFTVSGLMYREQFSNKWILVR